MPFHHARDPPAQSNAAKLRNHSGSPVTFTLPVCTAAGKLPATFVNLAGIPATLERVSGDDQHTTVSDAFAAPFVVRVRDIRSNPLAQVPVTFAVPATDPSAELSHIGTITDNDGLASFTAVADTTAGAFVATATALTLQPVILESAPDLRAHVDTR